MNNLRSVDSPPNELQAAKTEPTQTKKPYNKPTLYICGDFRDITLGSSAGAAESMTAHMGGSPFGDNKTRHYER